MNLLIITHVAHIEKGEKFFAYSPYVLEINIWSRYADEVTIVAPLIIGNPTAIDSNYDHKKIIFKKIRAFNAIGIWSKIKTLFKIPFILATLFSAMKTADHIHLRCPGNVGLLGCIVQIFFPKKPKTAKYAGNWDPNSKQPLSYKLQRWILSNTFITKNMQVLVYGQWPNQTKNVRPFFTATYAEVEKENILHRDLENRIEILFVGTLSEGKRPVYAVKLAHELIKKGYSIRLRIFGEGHLREQIQDYCKKEKLDSVIVLKGNQKKEIVQEAYKESHFLLLPSKSEGWPKVVAEAMFWGCVPLSTPVSCVPTMFAGENRGFSLELDLDVDSKKIITLIENQKEYQRISENGSRWSRQFTTEFFESEIQKLMKS